MDQLVLIADDDQGIRDVVRFALSRAGFKTVEAGDGQAALSAYRKDQPALIILDILMPEMDGTEVCRAIRRESRVPIIFLTSMDEEVDRVLGLELGGDDYINKPFSPRELVARVKAVLRRVSPGGGTPVDGSSKVAGAAELQSHGRLQLDRNLFVARWDNRDITLTATEFYLVETLLAYPGKVYSRDELVSRALGDDVTVTDRTIDTHVKRIRKKFQAHGADPIETVHGVGYKLTPCR